ncbi:hypothetical protein V7S43_008710 [Phytophthora oleae]|uniref:Crinkler effector protein N-terminal domain-containing protein n=1 Tax=Phytophthora oleae TaxID=2107226 RepID=A0ABD3FJA8_9STRA
MVELFCAIVGETRSAFPVYIGGGESVFALKAAIKAEMSNRFRDVDANKLQLFLAKKDKGRGVWLTEGEVMHGVSDTSDLKLLRSARAELGSVGLSEDDVRFQVSEEQVADLKGPVNVLVQPQTGLWLVSGSIEKALNTSGIRCRVYRLAASYLGYYDPNLRVGDTDKVLWYDEATLQIHAVFKDERDAMLFENELQYEGNCTSEFIDITRTSPIVGHKVSTKVVSVSRESSALRRIYSLHYVPEDTESQVAMSTTTSILDVETDDFKYQRSKVKSGSEVWVRHRAAT